MAQSLFGSFMLYIYKFLYCFSKRFLLAEYFVTVFQSVLNRLGWMALMPYVVNSILNRPTGAFIPLTGKISVIANLIWCKNRLCSLCCTEIHWLKRLWKTEWGICKWIGWSWDVGGVCLWSHCITWIIFLTTTLVWNFPIKWFHT